MHWAGFLVMGASTRLPCGRDAEKGNSETHTSAPPAQGGSIADVGMMKVDGAGALASKNASVASRLENLEMQLLGVSNNGMHVCMHAHAPAVAHTLAHTLARTRARARNTHTHTHIHIHTHTDKTLLQRIELLEKAIGCPPTSAQATIMQRLSSIEHVVGS